MLFNRLIKALPVTILILTIFFLCYKNYAPNTFLTGWDTLHPEFDYGIYWKRVLSGAWQSHQGLGAVSSQAHASEIPRLLVIMFMDVFLQTNHIRYAYAFLMLLIGPLGLYFFLKNSVLEKYSEEVRAWGALAGALVYLLNLGTLQHFNVPLEMFLTQYGFLGWVFLYATKIVRGCKKKDWILFGLLVFFMAPQAHSSTLFVAFFLMFSVYTFIFGFAEFLKKNITLKLFISKTFFVLFTTLFLNLFWLLPNIYFVTTRAGELQQSKIHLLFSQEAFLANKKFGNIKDISIMKSFLFDWGAHTGGGQFGELLGVWNSYYKVTPYLNVGYFIFVFICFGVLISLLKKSSHGVALAVVALMSGFFLLNVNPPFGAVFTYLQGHVPLFKEALRFPFTKFSVVLMFCYGVFFAYFWMFLLEIFKKATIKISWLTNIFAVVMSILLVTSLYLYVKPAFSGNLINPLMRVSIPKRYFEMFDYLNSRKDYGRVANLPIHSFWGWVHHNWDAATSLGYQGAGFLWFGIDKPLLDREFDRWNVTNEDYYNEMSYAVYSQNPQLFRQVLDKFKIKWVLLDESIIVPSGDAKKLFYPQTKEIVNGIPNLHLAKDFGGGLSVYEYDKDFSRTELIAEYYEAGPKSRKEPVDYRYEKGTYVQSDNVAFPFYGKIDFNEEIRSDFIRSDPSGLYLEPEINEEELLVSDTPQILPVFFENGGGGLVIKDFTTGAILFEDISMSSAGDYKTYFSINQNLIPSGSKGMLYLPAGKSLPIRKYDLGVPISKNSKFSGVLEPCGGISEGGSFSIVQTGKGFVLSGNSIQACVTSGLSDAVDLEDVVFPILLEVGYDTPENESFGNNFCVFDSGNGLCKNQIYSGGNYYVELGTPLEDLYVRFFSSHTTYSPEGSRYEVNNLHLSYFLPIGAEANLLLKDESVQVPVNDLLFYPRDPANSSEVNSLRHDLRLCDSADSLQGLTEVGPFSGAISYDSKKGSVCDSYYFHNLRHDQSYILEVRSSHQYGLPLQACLTNEYSKRCDLDLVLHRDPISRSQFYFIPDMGRGSGYTLNFTNLLISRESSRNTLEYISFTPVPLDMLKSFHTINHNVEKGELFVLNEAYDDGWALFCGLSPCSSSHMLVDNWRNGWLFPSGIPAGVKAIFLPNFLEYAGFIVVFFTFTFVVVLYSRLKNKSGDNKNCIRNLL